MIEWTAAKHNIADALTKKDLSAYKILNERMINESLHPVVLETAKRAKFTSQIS